MGTTYMWSKLKAVQAEKGSQAVGGQIELLTKLSKMMDRFVARQRQFHKQEHALSLSDSQSLPWLVGLANLMKSETNRRLHDMYNDDSTDLAANGLKIFGTAKSEALKLRPWLPVADAAYENSGKDFLNCLHGSSASESWGHVAEEDILLANWEPKHERPGFVLFRSRLNSEKSLVLAVRGTSSIDDVITDLDIERAPFMGSWVHGSILRSALAIERQLLPVLRSELESGVALTVTGHSLGAGVASLLTVVLRHPKEAEAAREAATRAEEDSDPGSSRPGSPLGPLASVEDKLPSFLADLVSKAQKSADKAREAIEGSEAGNRLISEASSAASAIASALGVDEPWRSAGVGSGGLNARCLAFATPSCASPELAASPAFRAVVSVVHGDDVIPRSSEANLLRLLLELQRNAQNWSERSKAELSEAEQNYLSFLEETATGVKDTVGTALSALREAHASLPESVLREHGSEIEKRLRRAEEDLEKKLAAFHQSAAEAGKGAFDSARRGVDDVLNEDSAPTGGGPLNEEGDVFAVKDSPSLQELHIPGSIYYLQRRLREKERLNRSEETAVALDVNLGSDGKDGELEMYYRILKADQRAFERLVLSENMVSDHACHRYDTALHSASGLVP